ncbi:Microsomal glutathione s-transferase, partial [Globisporangium splendens]
MLAITVAFKTLSTCVGCPGDALCAETVSEKPEALRSAFAAKPTHRLLLPHLPLEIMVQIVLLPEHGYIPLLVVLMGFVNAWAGVKVGTARKKYNIQYPQMYAEESDKNAKAFNSVQRAHQNVVENLSVFFALLFASAVFRPGLAAIAGLVRILGFIAYVRGYSTGDPKKRSQGFFGYIGMFTSIGLAVEASLRMLGVL